MGQTYWNLVSFFECAERSFCTAVAATEYTWEPVRSNAADKIGTIKNRKKFISFPGLRILPAHAG
jgi:hypothetical protein